MKDKLQTQIDDLKLQIKKANEYTDRARIELERLEEKLKECDKKPYMYTSLNNKYEIVKYRKYSHCYIEFETERFKHRYIVPDTFGDVKFPPKSGPIAYCSKDPIFEIHDIVSGNYVPADYIKSIELIPGVDEYDKNRKC